MNIVALGQLIQERRASLQIKQEDLAELSGISAKTIYMLENGKGNPSYSTLVKILNIVGLEISVKLKNNIE